MYFFILTAAYAALLKWGDPSLAKDVGYHVLAAKTSTMQESREDWDYHQHIQMIL